MTVIFIRHGETDYSLSDQRKLSSIEKNFLPLTNEAVKVIHSLSRDPIFQDASVILSSPYTRALQSASILNQYLQLPLVVEFDLREWIPDLSGARISVQEHIRRRNEFLKNNGVCPESEIWRWETKQALYERASSALSKYQSHQRVVAVTHSMVMGALADVDPDTIGFASVLTWEAKWK